MIAPTAGPPLRLLAPNGVPFDADPDLDAPLIGPPTLALVGGSARANACHMWRVWQPFARLQALGYPAEWGVNEDPRTVLFLPRFRVVVLCRLSWTREQQAGALRWFALSRKAGRRIVYECDDDLFSPFVVHQQHAGIAKETPVEQLEAERLASLWTMRQCDGVTVSTERLASVVRTFTDAPVEVVPNAIDVRWFRGVQAALGKRTVPGLTIGWAGGNRPDGDLAAMAEAWGRLAQRYPHVTFVLYGHQPAVVSRFVPETRLRRLPWRDVTEYPAELVNFDIACCPLENRHFNRCKCVVGDTLVNTAVGLEPIASLGPTCAVGGTISVTVIVWTREGWQVATEFYNGGEQDVLTVTTESGFQITGTEEHPVRRADLSWALLRDLQIGDELHLEPVQLSDKERAVAFNPWAIRNRREVDAAAESLPRIHIDRHWGALLGYLIGDGNIQKNAVRVTCDSQDEDVVADVMGHFRAIGVEPTLKTVRHNQPQYRGVDVCASSARFNDFLWALGIEREGRKFLGVPRIVLKSPSHVVRAFLAALFESDGTVDVTGSRAYLVTMSDRLAREVQLLLTAFGVRATVRAVFNRRYQRDYYRVMLSRSAVDVFADAVGFVGTRKQAQLAAITAKPHSNRYTPQNWTDRVLRIERGRAPVYDLTVPKNHEFAAGGFIVHNTPIKAWEYALSGAAVVASPTVYGRCIDGVSNGLLAETVDEWEAHLSRLVEREDERRALARGLERDVLAKWSLDKQYRRWPEAWRRLGGE